MLHTQAFFLNGQKYVIHEKITLFDLLNYFDYNLTLLVVEYNNFICPQIKWKNIYIENYDKIEIITIVGGG